MDEILSIFGIFALGFFVGWWMREQLALRRIDKMLTQIEDELDEAEEASLVKIKIEKHSEVFYVFNQETDEFMAQGIDRKELEDALAKKFPEKTFMATPANLKEVGFQ